MPGTACITPTRVRVTTRLPRFRNRRKVETWAAESVERDGDGQPAWSFARLEMTSTPWEVRSSRYAHGFAWYSTLDAAAIATADGSALAAIERMEAEIAQTAARLTETGRASR